MNDLHKLLTELKPVHSYRLKFAFEPSKEELSRIMTRLTDRYDATSFSPLVKTIFQVKPMDFPNLDCGEIWWMDFECTRGLQPDVLLYEIGSMLRVSEALLHVRNNADPYQQQIADTEDDLDFDEEITSLLLDPEHKEVPEIDADKYVGAGRTTDLLKQLGTEVKDEVPQSTKKESSYAKYLAAGFGER